MQHQVRIISAPLIAIDVPSESRATWDKTQIKWLTDELAWALDDGFTIQSVTPLYNSLVYTLTKEALKV